MKIKFNPDLDFQADALSSIFDLFDGQETCQTNFTVAPLETTAQLGFISNDKGIGNRLVLLEEDLLFNLQKTQLRNGLKPSQISPNELMKDLNFTVEMETGTGKTYVYLRSVFELNRRYGFTKFIIVVPSIAIKEGAYKSLQMTEEHFKGLYDNVRFDFFVYDSQKLGQVRNFATSDCIQIMVINIDAFRRSFTDPSKESKANIIHRPHDRMTGSKPIEFIQATNPIVIIDEPQSVDTTKKSAEALASLNPLCTFRYSATHRDKHHQVFRLDSVDAYDRKQPLGVDTSKEVWEHLKTEGYIDSRGKVTDKLRGALKDDSLQLPETVAEQAGQVATLLKKVAGSLNVKNADERTKVRLNKERFLGEDFKELWDRIKYKTTFRVKFDTKALIQTCADEIKNSPVITKARFVYRKSTAEIGRAGVGMGTASHQTYNYDAEHMRPPDIVSFLQNETNLTRRSIVEILRRSVRLGDFKRNPNKFIEQVLEIIKTQMRLFIVDGIKYHRIGDDEFYGQELFQDQELFGYLSKNMLEAKKSVYDHVVYDSEVEREFAERLDQSVDVKVYAKLPDWFKIETPLGTYNPDWAVLVERDGSLRLFFVVETKGSLLIDALRPTEQAKIDCGKAHFKALGTDVEFTVANSYDSFEGTFEASAPNVGPESREPQSSAGNALPFRRIDPAKVEPFVNAVPLYDLKIAAGRFSGEQVVDEVPQQMEVENPEDYDWVSYDGRHRPAQGLFVAQVVGESMNKRIPNGAYCLWRLHPAGSRGGRVVLAQHRDIHDSELGGHYTVKIYESEKEHLDDETWRHKQIILKPSSSDPSFQPIVLRDLEDGELEIIAELVEVLGDPLSSTDLEVGR